MTKFKNRRGFSLVELMVVVAIMGTLAAIAIPAYNEYRKAAKKTAYRTDLLGLHKGVQAFGVELDSFCQRETSPVDYSIDSVGMTSLLSSGLYGERLGTATTAGCTPAGGATCSGIMSNGKIIGCNNTSTPQTGSCAYRPERSANLGPGKDNFIGFSNVNTGCSNFTATAAYVHFMRNGADTTNTPAACDLRVAAYEMGVVGHLSGADFIGFDVTQDGVVTERDPTTPTYANVITASCT